MNNMKLKQALITGYKVLRRIITGIVFTAIICLTASNVYTLVAKSYSGNKLPTVLGYGSVVVISGSMEPEIKVGDLLIIKEQPDGSYRVGDVVTYLDGNNLVTHRIIAIDQDEKNAETLLVTTQGDSNNTADEPFPIQKIKGKVVAVPPYVGAAIMAVKTPLGMVALLVVGFLAIEIPYLFNKRRSKNNQPKDRA